MARRNAGRCRKYESSRLRTMMPMVVTPPRIAARVSLVFERKLVADVDVRIEDSRQHDLAAGIEHVLRRSGKLLADGGNAAAMPTSAATVLTPGIMSVPSRTTRSKR